jgi:hypothetical protein
MRGSATIVIRWYALSWLGVQGIRIGPSIPAFLQTNAGRRFMKKNDISQAKSVAEDLATING